MKQVLQSLKSGAITSLSCAPAPQCPPGQLLIATRRTLISAGTERMLVEFGQANLIQKAAAQPERVRQVLDKVQTDGLLPTLDAVFAKLDDPLPLGYCNAGVVLEVGAGVQGFAAGDRVVSNGRHAEIVCVPQNLCARIPDPVEDDCAAFTVLAAVGLQGIRLAAPTLGETVAVMGLGLVGLMTVQMLVANGCRVLGFDLNPQRLALARQFGAEVVNVGEHSDPVTAGLAFSAGRGVDAVLITASSKGNEIVHQAAQMSRQRGRIVLVGDVGLSLSRADFYAKELTFQVSCSYGPGRYDEQYEQQGHDYPLGFVRWTEQRNFEAVLQLMAAGRLDVAPLITHRIPLDQAQEAYRHLAETPNALGILLTYPDQPPVRQQTIALPAVHTIAANGGAVVGVIGAGSFSRRVLLPALRKTEARLKTIASTGGTSAGIVGRNLGFAYATSDYRQILDDPEINTVFVVTQHNSHARLVCEALRAGKHVFVEKPLAINREQLADIQETVASVPYKQLMVGFNRRFAPQAVRLRDLLASRTEPCTLLYTVNAGHIPPEHWTQDAAVGGGRIIGEACHFIDLLLFLVGSPIAGVEARMVRPSSSRSSGQDKMTICLDFEDGSSGVVHYLSHGSKRFPKERLEVFSEQRVAVLDNFNRLYGYGWPGLRTLRSLKQDKGHEAEITAFIQRVQQGGDWLIPWQDLRDVTLSTFAAVERAAEPPRHIHGQIGSC